MENIALDYSSKFMFLGSCFAENIHEKLRTSGFNSYNNPFGITFNPISIADFILNENDALFKDTAFLQRDNIHLNWFVNSKIYGLSKDAFKQNLIAKRNSFLAELKNADVLFITLGTAFVYEKENVIVSNCHKVPQNQFNKRMLCVEEIETKFDKVYSTLKDCNKNLKIVFTVSPVRHIKDGLIENNRSKAVLFNFISNFETKCDVGYFPAYELVIDELRDYSYYKDDKVHPNAKAINHVFNVFTTKYLNDSCKKTSIEYLKLKQYFQHKPIHPESSAQLQADENMQEKLNNFLAKHKNIRP